MQQTYRTGAKGALLDEYENVLQALIHVIADISDQELVHLIDTTTKNDNCRSFQTVLAHVVHAVYAYSTYIDKLYGHTPVLPDKQFHPTVSLFIADLRHGFQYTVDVFRDIKDTELEVEDADKKILTPWGQLYDIEQMMEHAIVHVMRHRRQLEKFKILLQR
ncbi:DinB family protein [Chitinophaga nivalis]|uniref:DinB family protein n=1 Tax=Chitinophaga nivalis TaxID=2991709 RepID=A0ABT3IMA5_9BACT|nr:DinB family protein [Chitinophaga nivalis]MCW3465212.1 DinB family protein [Chitinophaga nivalis]MCW3485096.1 DinB family protein [Chitinophaga nivalis]